MLVSTSAFRHRLDAVYFFSIQPKLHALSLAYQQQKYTIRLSTHFLYVSSLFMSHFKYKTIQGINTFKKMFVKWGKLLSSFKFLQPFTPHICKLTQERYPIMSPITSCLSIQSCQHKFLLIYFNSLLDQASSLLSQEAEQINRPPYLGSATFNKFTCKTLPRLLIV